MELTTATFSILSRIVPHAAHPAQCHPRQLSLSFSILSRIVPHAACSSAIASCSAGVFQYPLADRPSCSSVSVPYSLISLLFQYPLADRPSCSPRCSVPRSYVPGPPFSILSRIAPHAASAYAANEPDDIHFQYPLADRPSCSHSMLQAQCSSCGPFSILSRIAPHAA